jgi:hypothetical protein
MEDREKDGQEAISKERPKEAPGQNKTAASDLAARERDEPHLPQYDSFMRVIRR